MYSIFDLHTKEAPLSGNYVLPLVTSAAEKKRIHLVGLGDVGRTVVEGILMRGGRTFSELGFYDLNADNLERMEIELGQASFAFDDEERMQVRALKKEELFDCDVFAFCATAGVPPVSVTSGDVRMMQFEKNAAIVSLYAAQAAEEGFGGLFCVVSDPVDLLCMSVLRATLSKNRSLDPFQIQGFGLGVMHARALSIAQKEGNNGANLVHLRAYGPHGAGLVIANSYLPEEYDDAYSRSLTKSVSTVNLRIREKGFKPYIAPAFASAVLSIERAVRGEWNNSCNYLNGLYFGCRNRRSVQGIEWEDPALPEALFERLIESYQELEQILWKA